LKTTIAIDNLCLGHTYALYRLEFAEYKYGETLYFYIKKYLFYI
jgi:hypothetical protein